MASRGSSAWREEHWRPWRCSAGRLVTRVFLPGIRLHVAEVAVPAYRILFSIVRKHGYRVWPAVTGAYNCRRITGGSSYSAHAYGIAVDLNWDVNPYVRGRLVTDMPTEMVEEILRVRTSRGAPVWRWGGDWDTDPSTAHKYYDAMHYEVVATPEELRAGIDRSLEDGVPIAGWPVLRRDDEGPAVRYLQDQLHMPRLEDRDGRFDEVLEAIVRDYQYSRGLDVDGVVGPGTWTALEYRLPIVPPGERRPDKGIQGPERAA